MEPKVNGNFLNFLSRHPWHKLRLSEPLYAILNSPLVGIILRRNARGGWGRGVNAETLI